MNKLGYILCFRENIGENILYQWVEAVKEFLQERENASKTPEDETDIEINLTVAQLSLETSPETKDLAVPRITHGTTVVDRKSIFQGHVAVIKSVEQVK